MLERLARKHYDRGRQFELQDRLEEAIDAYRRAVALDPPFYEPFLALGRIEASRGRFEKALELLDRADQSGDDPEIRHWRGYVHGRLASYDEALSDYRSVEDFGDPHVQVNIGRMLLALGRYDEAETVLSQSEDEKGKQLYAALPRYREFRDEPMDDQRVNRYLFGGTMVIGTLGDGGLRLASDRYMLLTPDHIAVTVQRFCALVRENDWRFDGVAGRGAHHAPVAGLLAHELGLPLLDDPQSGVRVLVASAVVKGPVEAASLTRPWRAVNARIMHFALGLVPSGDPNPLEPEVVGFVSRCAVPWYRVESYARLEADMEVRPDATWPGFKIGPARVDPNSKRVVGELVDACAAERDDDIASSVFAWYAKHSQVRAFQWCPGEEDP